jgi:SAM-dependent methyltransferase
LGLTLYYTLGNVGQFRYYRCEACTLVNYDLAGGLDQRQYVELVDPSDDRAERNYDKDATWRFVETHLPIPRRFLDIGCGTGRLLYLAKRSGSIVKGLELSAEMADLARRRVGADVVVGDFLKIDLTSEDRYDLITLRHVLEHLPDSRLAMIRINRLLRPGAHALLEFPNIEGADRKLKRFVIRMGLYKRQFSADFVAGHCNEFCKSSFAYLAEQTGFTIVHWETYSMKPLTNFIYNRIHIGNKARVLIRKRQEY